MIKPLDTGQSDRGEAVLAEVLRSASEAHEQPSPAMHGRIMGMIRERGQIGTTPAGRIRFVRPLLAIAAVAALAGGITLFVVSARHDQQTRTEQARAFVRVTLDLTESAQGLERRMVGSASTMLIKPIEREARAFGSQALGVLDRIRQAVPGLVVRNGASEG